MPRLFDTLTAATNWPRLRKPAEASIRSVPCGRRPCSLLASCVLRCSFCCTGVSVTDVDPVPPVVLVLVVAVDLVFVFVFGAVDVFVVECAETCPWPDEWDAPL